MGKYKTSSVKAVREKSKQPHFVWRGIGCVIILIVPVMSWALGVETIKFALDQGFVVPYQLLVPVRYPDFFYKSSGLMTILSPITHTIHFYAKATAAFLYMILLSGISSMSYALVYRIMGPPRYSPLDAPPPKFKAKPYKR
jgi:hypothetical protein